MEALTDIQKAVYDYTRKTLRQGRPLNPILRHVAATDAASAVDIEALAKKAPRQAELLETLLDAGGNGIDVQSLAEQMPAWRRSFRALAGKGLAAEFEGLEPDITEENIQSRLRGVYLMALSNKFGHMVLSTGNKSEMAVGYCTLYGDMSGGLAVISDVPKQLVYELSRFVNIAREIIPERIIEKPPSAELKPDQLDQDDLPPYEILDAILELYLEEGKGITEIIDLGYAEALVHDIIHRVRINEYKRKQAPMGLKVTTKAFGCGRRYPTTQRYRG